MGAEKTTIPTISTPRMMAWVANDLLSNPAFNDPVYRKMGELVHVNDNLIPAFDLSDEMLAKLNEKMPFSLLRSTGAGVYAKQCPDIVPSEAHGNVLTLMLSRMMVPGRSNKHFYRKMAIAFKRCTPTFKICTDEVLLSMVDEVRALLKEHGFDLTADRFFDETVRKMALKVTITGMVSVAEALASNASLATQPSAEPVPAPANPPAPVLDADACARLLALMNPDTVFPILVRHIRPQISATGVFTYPKWASWDDVAQRPALLAQFEHEVLSDEFLVTAGAETFTIQPFPNAPRAEQPAWCEALLLRVNSTSTAHRVVRKAIRNHLRTNSVTEPIPMSLDGYVGTNKSETILTDLRDLLGDAYTVEMVDSGAKFTIRPNEPAAPKVENVSTDDEPVKTRVRARLLQLLDADTRLDFGIIKPVIMKQLGEGGDRPLVFPIPSGLRGTTDLYRATLFANFEHRVLLDEFEIILERMVFRLRYVDDALPIEQPAWYPQLLAFLDQNTFIAIIGKTIRNHCRVFRADMPIPLPLAAYGGGEQARTAIHHDMWCALNEQFTVTFTDTTFTLLPRTKLDVVPAANTETATPTIKLDQSLRHRLFRLIDAYPTSAFSGLAGKILDLLPHNENGCFFYPKGDLWESNLPFRAQSLAAFECAVLKGEFEITGYPAYFTISPAPAVLSVKQPDWYWALAKILGKPSYSQPRHWFIRRAINRHCRVKPANEPIEISLDVYALKWDNEDGVEPRVLFLRDFRSMFGSVFGAALTDSTFVISPVLNPMIEPADAAPVCTTDAPTKNAKPVQPPWFGELKKCLDAAKQFQILRRHIDAHCAKHSVEEPMALPTDGLWAHPEEHVAQLLELRTTVLKNMFAAEYDADKRTIRFVPTIKPAEPVLVPETAPEQPSWYPALFEKLNASSYYILRSIVLEHCKTKRVDEPIVLPILSCMSSNQLAAEFANVLGDAFVVEHNKARNTIWISPAPPKTPAPAVPAGIQPVWYPKLAALLRNHRDSSVLAPHILDHCCTQRADEPIKLPTMHPWVPDPEKDVANVRKFVANVLGDQFTLVHSVDDRTVRIEEVVPLSEKEQLAKKFEAKLRARKRPLEAYRDAARACIVAEIDAALDLPADSLTKVVAKTPLGDFMRRIMPNDPKRQKDMDFLADLLVKARGNDHFGIPFATHSCVHVLAGGVVTTEIHFELP